MQQQHLKINNQHSTTDTRQLTTNSYTTEIYTQQQQQNKQNKHLTTDKGKRKWETLSILTEISENRPKSLQLWSQQTDRQHRYIFLIGNAILVFKNLNVTTTNQQGHFCLPIDKRWQPVDRWIRCQIWLQECAIFIAEKISLGIKTCRFT